MKTRFLPELRETVRYYNTQLQRDWDLVSAVTHTSNQLSTATTRRQIFGYYLFDHHGDGMIAFTCKSSLNEQRRLVKDDPDSFFVPPYLGSKGWIAIRLDLNEVDWETVTELARRAYQDIAPRKLSGAIE